MDQLTHFFHWIQSSASLFEITPPMIDFRQFDAIPAPKLQAYQGNRRLGFVYQHLCQQWLHHSRQFEIKAEELQLNHDGQTIGAIDFIVENHQQRQTEHWEVAIKFYLLHQGLWYGPNAKDRLDKKLAHMLNHQLTLSQKPTFKQLWSDPLPLQPKLLMQGRLYINPFQPETIPTHCHGYQLNPSQISGYWCYQHQWPLIKQPLFTLDKPCWATGLTDLSQPILSLPERFIHAQTADGQFWFIVPDNWPEQKK
ncbi:DUF1853 family protein [Vibrio sp.]|uniref:DUF1853 family protein n=1 Tax=Vibrio sp. TaxID=678 RepID=UPI003D0ED4E9